MARNVALYPWLRFSISLLFWQATWLLYFQGKLTAAEALVLFVISDMVSLVMEVPSGWFSDRFGRRRTLILSGVLGVGAAACLALGDSFAVFAVGQALLGANMAFVSGTDSAMLYESLDAQGRADAVEREEIKAMRFTFAAMALSAIVGGLAAPVNPAFPYIFFGGAMVAVCALSALMTEPPGRSGQTGRAAWIEQWVHLKQAFSHPVLLWMLAFSLLMYAYSHTPFVFGQPYMADMIQNRGYDIAPEVLSGAVAAMMTVLPFATSIMAPTLRRGLGLPVLLLASFAIHLAVAAALAVSAAPWVLLVLFLRRVPDSLSRPFVLARVQPLLASDNRATYLSLVSLFGRLVLSGALLVAAASSDASGMNYADMQSALTWFFGLGVLFLAILALTARVLNRPQ